MAFVPGYEHDIFVSYAHVDNEPDPGVEQGWVSTLVNGVKIRLAQRLGRSEGYSLWKDYLLSSHTPLTPEIIQTVKSSATMILVLSPGYLKSPWCLKELKTFREAVVQRQRANSRAFIVERDRIDESERLAELQDLKGYRFWVLEKEAKHPRILGDPIPNPHDPAHQPYYDQLRDLSCDLADELKRLKSLPEPAVSEPQVQEPDTRPAVFLAEVTDDLLQQRDEVRRYLDQAGIRTLPQGFLYLSQPDDFEQAVDRDLKDCKLFVQLLSDIGGRKPPGRPTYSRIQYERALKAGVPILQWRSPALKPDAVSDAEHRELLERDTVLAVGLEEFKSELVKRTFYKPESKPPPGDAFVFLNVDRVDHSLAQDVCQVVHRYGMGCATPLREGDPAEIRQDLEENLSECDGVIVVYGAVTANWARGQLRQCRKIMSKRERPLKALAVYEGPPEEKIPLDFMLPGMMVINCRQCLVEGKLQPFLEALRTGGTP